MHTRTMIHSRKAFTLLELILVMLILAVASAFIVPSMVSFATGRATDNASILVLNLATYARTQSMSEGTTYRLNFDTNAGELWLTRGRAGVFAAPNNDYNRRFPLSPGIRMKVDVIPQANTTLVVSSTVQPEAVQPVPAFGQQLTPLTNNLMQIPHTDPGTYMEFQPSGRTDPAHITLTDKSGKIIDLGLATSTEMMHVLSAQEMQ